MFAGSLLPSTSPGQEPRDTSTKLNWKSNSTEGRGAVCGLLGGLLGTRGALPTCRPQLTGLGGCRGIPCAKGLQCPDPTAKSSRAHLLSENVTNLPSPASSIPHLTLFSPAKPSLSKARRSYISSSSAPQLTLLLGKFGVLLFYPSVKQQFQPGESDGSVRIKTEGARQLLLDMC